MDEQIRQILKRLANMQLQSDQLDYDVVAISDTVEELMKLLASDDVGEPVAQAVVDSVFSREQASAILDIATWSGGDNGAQLQGTLNRWVREANSEIKVWLAVNHHVFPFPTKGEMVKELERVQLLFPQMRERCEYLMHARRDM